MSNGTAGAPFPGLRLRELVDQRLAQKRPQRRTHRRPARRHRRRDRLRHRSRHAPSDSACATTAETQAKRYDPDHDAVLQHALRAERHRQDVAAYAREAAY
ncbi:hypothetical protein ACH4E7_43610 [Kitasatospora sp. NPDC018058]|uniref:hypothetical protein n=1 Tax=Kitasatospora sp. NPDC018058 TaxID=3364025 RepID=UPI0037C0A532